MVGGEMTPELLRAIGRALYGERWIFPLARDLGVSSRTVARWDHEGYPVPDERWVDLMALCKARGGALAQIVQKLERVTRS